MRYSCIDLRLRRILIASIVATPLTGCGLQDILPLPAPAGIPAPLLAALQTAPDHIVENHPLADVPPGTVIDDLSGIAGCWVHVYTDSANQPNALSVREYSLEQRVVRFHYWATRRSLPLSTNPWPDSSLSGDEYHNLQLAESNRVTADFASGFGYDKVILSGVVLPNIDFVYEMIYFVPSEDLATLSGDYLKTVPAWILEEPSWSDADRERLLQPWTGLWVHLDPCTP